MKKGKSPLNVNTNILFKPSFQVAIIVTFITFLVCLLSSCTFGNAPTPLKGGRVTLTPQKTVIEQPVNSDKATTFSFTRNITTNSGIISTNITLQTVLGEHQPDTARNAWGTVQIIAKRLESANKLYYLGGFFMMFGIILAALSRIYNAGIKVILGCEIVGIILCLLPTAITDTASKFGILAMAIFMVWVVAKKFNDNNTTTKTK